jgi:hypothetical protein
MGCIDHEILLVSDGDESLQAAAVALGVSFWGLSYSWLSFFGGVCCFPIPLIRYEFNFLYGAKVIFSKR